jgi:ketosteroid isomerase-like protein
VEQIRETYHGLFSQLPAASRTTNGERPTEGQEAAARMSRDNLAIKDRFVTAVFSDDRATIERLLAPGFELHQPAGLPYEGVYRGREGFFVFLDKYMQAYDLEALDGTMTYVGQDPDLIVLEFQCRGKLKFNGSRFESLILERWAFHDGKIARMDICWFQIPR